MLAHVPVTPIDIEEYRPIVGDATIDELRALSEPLRGMVVHHVNATAFGGGVAEILQSLVPILQSLGIRAEWRVIRGADEFFSLTKRIHNSLQGLYAPFTPDDQQVYLRYQESNAALVESEADVTVVHDPQPAGLFPALIQLREHHPGGGWIWRCHIDLTEAQPDVWDFVASQIAPYDAVVFSLEQFVRQVREGQILRVLAPAIDPRTPKNAALSLESSRSIVARHGVDPDRPFLLQVSRFDPWKDPQGVIDVYRMIKQVIPRAQLVLIASMADDDPEGWSYYERTARRAGEDFDIHLLSNLNGVGNVEVNAFQQLATVVLQKSIREGFGLTVTEALWKARPVVASNAGGIPLQIINGKTGYLVGNNVQCAAGALRLLQKPRVAARIGRNGREHVRRHFLITRLVRDELMLYRDVLRQRALAGGERQPISQ